ncbi:unnamed protein product [Orchesella dallaii]|uniref:C2H2-type domain-containing protein n=1 Tax=Orchesella dallaii TaxID=48710 RepID=A0ABP1SAF5_9HEXA
MNLAEGRVSEPTGMCSEYPIYCPVCGDNGDHDPCTLNMSSRTNIFQYFLKFFRTKWRGKVFSLCGECKAQLVLISELKTQLKELKRRVKDQEDELESKMINSERKFEMRKLYGRDKRYFKLRRQILGDRVIQPEPQTSDLVNGRRLPSLLLPQQLDQPLSLEFIKVEMEEEEPEEEVNLPITGTYSDYDDDDQEVLLNEQAQNQVNSESGGEEESEIEMDQYQEELETPPKPTTTRRQRQEVKEQPRRSTRNVKRQKVIPSTEPESTSEGEQQQVNDDDGGGDSDEFIVWDEDQQEEELNSKRKRTPKTKPKRGKVAKEKKVIDKSTITVHDCELYLLPEENKYKCSKCSSILPNLGRIYRYHVVKEHTDLYACPKCFKRFGKGSHLQRHMETIHPTLGVSPSSQHLCTICSRPFTRADSIKGHMWTHYSEQEKTEALARGEKAPFRVGKRFHCEVEGCERSFSTTTCLAHHLKQMHQEGNAEEDKILCGICGSTVLNLKKHMLVKHTAYQDRRFECGICKRKFVHSSGLKHHRKVAHEMVKEWKCDLCDMEFKFEKSMQEHRLGHGAEKPFQCTLCGMSFTRLHVLRRHVASIHEGKIRKDSKLGKEIRLGLV